MEFDEKKLIKIIDHAWKLLAVSVEAKKIVNELTLAYRFGTLLEAAVPGSFVMLEPQVDYLRKVGDSSKEIAIYPDLVWMYDTGTFMGEPKALPKFSVLAAIELKYDFDYSEDKVSWDFEKLLFLKNVRKEGRKSGQAWANHSLTYFHSRWCGSNFVALLEPFSVLAFGIGVGERSKTDLESFLDKIAERWLKAESRSVFEGIHVMQMKINVSDSCEVKTNISAPNA